MPGRNSIKVYVENSYYHLYNRGVEKRTIFQDTQDYKVFLKYLKEYLSPPIDTKDKKKTFTLKGCSFQGVPHQPKNYCDEIKLLCYCLMPNHFHLLIQQISSRSMENFMRSLITRYSMYFNKKYNRIGTLFQGIYKAIMINKDEYLLHLSRYIHLNPSEYSANIKKAYSSYAEYLGIRKTEWIKPEFILNFFNKAKFPFKNINSYQNFVEKYIEDGSKILGKLLIEEP